MCTTRLFFGGESEGVGGRGGGEYQSVNGLFAVKVLVDVWGPKLFADVTVIQGTDSRESQQPTVWQQEGDSSAMCKKSTQTKIIDSKKF